MFPMAKSAPKKASAPAKKAAPSTGAAKAPAKAAATKATATKAPATRATGAPASKKAAATKAVTPKPPAKKAAPSKSAPAESTPSKAAPARSAPSKAGPSKAASTKSGTAKAAPSKAAPAKSAPAKAAEAPPKPKPVNPFEAKFLEGQRSLLLEERAKLVGQADHLDAEAAQLMEDLDPGDVQFDDESGEGDSLVVERERDLALAGQARQTVTEIDAALRRIDEGVYGLSVISGRPIPKERLRALPWATELVEEKVGGLGTRR
jgi:RNA polymerase-binding transcription factor DksA